MNTITQYLHREKLDEQTAKKMNQLTKNKLNRTIKEVAYAQGRLRQRSRTGCLAERSNSE
ncbi:hypothetical protein [Pseudoflavonifractor sp. An44]|uniref:hypothetical protein n=1 Tax=Pseudoflavonifractor sp. An44 TaxID=1965635 RepID=UPI00117B5F92|nr:hypothetical protein [Pseudoflavonifractor sp. An44]